MEKISSYFFELIQIALNTRKQLSRELQREDWYKLYEMSYKQSVLALILDAIEILRNEGKRIVIPQDLLLQWIADAEQIKMQNKLINSRIIEVSCLMFEAGFRSCILKGQGNSIMYSKPFSRTPGDIDVWVKGERKDIKDFVRSKTKDALDNYHHIDFPIYNDVDVEVHYTPSWLNNPLANRKLQYYYASHRSVQCNHICRELDKEGRVCIPTRDFNLIFQMSHMMNHFFNEGLGLRQVIDYFFLLKQNFSEIEKREYRQTMTSFGMKKFACSMMWIMKEALGLDDEYLLLEPYKKGGQLVLKEILKTGNFGQQDGRFSKKYIASISTTLSNVTKNAGLFRIFPSEAILAPSMTLWHRLRYK